MYNQPPQGSHSMLNVVTDIANSVHGVGHRVQFDLRDVRQELAKAGVKESAAIDRIERELQFLLAIDATKLVFQVGAGGPGGSSPGGSSPGGSSPGGSSPGGSSPGGFGEREMIYNQLASLATAVFQVQQIFQHVQVRNLGPGIAVTSPRDESEARSLAPKTPPTAGDKG